MKNRSRFGRIGALTLLLCLSASSLVYATREKITGYPVPDNKTAFYGVQLDTSSDSVDSYSQRFGKSPAIVGRYTNFPMHDPELSETEAEVKQLAAHHSTLMLTLEPRSDLTAVTPAALDKLTTDLTRWNRNGVPVLVRFAHEMNGSWYPWAQQPLAYVKAFRAVSKAVHKAPTSSVLWSPNEGGGYPFAGGPYAAKLGTADFNALDTNHDGTLSMQDDPYSPYWPGADSVDWVGLSLYHFGNVYPWGENEVPSPTKITDKIDGTYNYAGQDETAVPNFYTSYAKAYNKPFAISETGAFYNTSTTVGASEYAIKSAWWQQLFAPSLIQRYPNLKMAVWFEYKKTENDSGDAVIDWRVTANADIMASFLKDMNPVFITGK